MSSAASGTTSSAPAKKVEWYHLDKVAIAKRICLDPATVKLKTALNNNNNNTNTNNNNYSKIILNSTPGTATNAAGKALKSSGVGGSGTSSDSTANNISKSSLAASTTSSSYDIVHLLFPPGGHRPKEPGSSTAAKVVSHSTAAATLDASPSKGIYAVRYNATALNGTANNKPVASFVTSVAGSRQFAALQQKRRRKAQRLAASTATGTTTEVTSADSKKQSQQKKEKSEQQRSSFLDEHGLIGVKSGSCGSSSRSSSSGVSSDFEELDGTTTTMPTRSANIKVASTNAGSRQAGNSSSSSSECEDEDDEGPHLVPPSGPPYVALTKLGKTVSGTSASVGNSSLATSNIKNKNNLSNLSVISSVVMVDGGSVSSGSSGKVGKSGRSVDMSRIVNKKVIHHHSASSGGGGSSVLGKSAYHQSSSIGVNKSSKMEVGGSTLNRCKHANGSTHSLSSASSTVSGSTDNDRDTDNSFSEFPADLDFLGVSDKGKRRTDRYDSSESSDSGVATLSPGTSESPELISTCCDYTSDHLDVGNLISASRSSSLSTASSLFPQTCSSKSCSSLSLASTCSATSTHCLTETQGDPQTGSSVSTTSTIIIEATLPSSSSTGSEAGSIVANPPIQETLCQWKGCTCSTEATHNILEHIQTTHVAPQMKTVGYVCLWEGCKVFNKRSSSLSWLERHVLSHSGNKPFKCIFPGCGLSFSSQNALERHVNSHIATNGTTNGAQANSTLANKKLDGSPAKASRRKKLRLRKQRINIGQRVDYFDKRIMEVIKHWLASSVDQYAVNAHDCTFRSEIIATRVIANCERQVLARWYPRFVFDDEWIPESKYSNIKLVPLRRIPSDKIRLLYPALFPPERKGKASRKRKHCSNTAYMSPRSISAHSEGSSSLTTLPASPNLSPSEIASLIDTSVSFINTSLNSSRSTRSSSSSSSSSASLCSSFSSSASTSSTSSASSSHMSFNLSTSASSSSQMIRMMMDTSNVGVKSEVDTTRGVAKCHNRFCGSSPCDCNESALLEVNRHKNDDEVDDEKNDDANNDSDSSHWALQLLYEDLGMCLS